MSQKRSRATFEADLQAAKSPYVFFGTALPPLDRQTRDDGSYVPVWKQEVTDEQGRKRLHGAFTGGFSAGYFNSVGSKEGWTPQTFVSSRSNRAKATQKAEDFMDDEDLADAEEAKVLETKGGFSGFGSTEDEVGGRGAFMDLFRMQGDTMGVKLLRRMGWTEGQGIGTRQRATTGSSQAGEAGAQMASKMIAFVRKTDTKGLGLGRERSAAESGRHDRLAIKTSSPVTKVKKPKPKRGGFGVGILNDTGSDEDDPYDVGPKLSYSRVADKKKAKKAENGIVASSSNPLLPSRPVFVKKATSESGFRRCHDGKLPIDGFVLSTSGPYTQDKKYVALKVPDGWQPSRQGCSLSEPSETASTADLAKASTLNPSSRAALLGESLLPGQSVFDFLSPAARDKLATASNNPSLPAGKYEAPPVIPERSPPSEESLIPELDPQIAATALQRTSKGFVPYSDNPEKLSRYQSFLSYRSDSSTQSLPPKCPPGTSPTDFRAELQEFANAATIFKPVSVAMASRFTTSASASNAGSTTASKDDEGNAIPLLTQGDKKLTPEQEAAKLGMYGPLTRKTTTFFPTRLLCKRFGVSAPMHVQPEPENGTVATSSGGNRGSVKIGGTDALAGFASRFTSGGVQGAESETKESGRKDRLEILGKKDMDEMRRAAGLPALGEVVRRKERELVVDTTRNEALEGERPSEGTFKEIFGGDE